MLRTSLLCAAALAVSANLAHAGEDATIIHGGEQVIEVKRVEHHVHRTTSKRLTKVVVMEAEDRIVTLAKAQMLAGMTDKNDLIHVELVNENVLLDPNKDYLRQNFNSIDANNLVPAAQRLARDLRSNKATIVFGGSEMTPMSEVGVRPLMIIERPGNAAPKKVIPSVPAPPQKSNKPLVALAD
jgi:hypothetical protein